MSKVTNDINSECIAAHIVEYLSCIAITIIG